MRIWGWVFSLWCCGAGAFDFRSLVTPPSAQRAGLRFQTEFQSVLQEQLNLSVPLSQSEDAAVLFAFRQSYLQFPKGVAPVPAMQEYQLGFTYLRQTAAKNLWSLGATFGSASDLPFKDSSVDTVGATFTYQWPQADNGYWLFLLNYSNNRPILNGLPLPGVVYGYFPNKEFRANFGVPFTSLNWEFIPGWSVNLFTVVPWTLRLQLGYRLFGPFQLYSGLEFSQVTFLTFGRANAKERTYYDERRAYLGIKGPLSQSLYAELEAGYAPRREIFSAESYSRDKSYLIQLESAFFSRLSLSLSL